MPPIMFGVTHLAILVQRGAMGRRELFRTAKNRSAEVLLHRETAALFLSIVDLTQIIGPSIRARAEKGE